MNLRLDGLRLQFLIFAILPLSVLLLALALVGVRVHGQTMRRVVAERDGRYARAAAALINERVQSRREVVKRVASGLESAEAPGDTVARFARLGSGPDLGVAVLAADGRVLAGSLAVDLSPAALAAVPPAGEPIVLILERAPLEGAVAFIAARAGKLTVVAAMDTLELLRRPLGGVQATGEGLRSILVGPEGILLAVAGEVTAGEYLPRHPGVEAALRGESGYAYYPAEGGEHVVAFSAIRAAGWALIIEEPWAEVASPLYRLSMAAPLSLIPALVAAVGGLWFAARSVIQPLRRLQQAAGRLSAGDYSAVSESVGGVAEIQELQRRLSEMAHRTRSSQEALRGYIGRITRVQEEERGRLARELHDDTIQGLIGLDQRLQMEARDRRDSRPAIPPWLDELRDDVQKMIRNVRRLSQGLRPVYLEELGLVAAVEMLVRDADSSSGIAASITVAGERRRLSAEAELAVYRIVQEALANIVRHSRARSAHVDLRFGTQELRVSVRDDGIGLEAAPDWNDLARDGHYGLIGMLERAQAAGAAFSFDAAPGTGATVEVVLPFGAPGGTRTPQG